MAFTVLFVCTGNVCRSPMAELMLLARAEPGCDLRVGSAGTYALAGEGVDGASAAALHELGIDPTGHRARQFQPDQASAADLVLTATREQRDVVITRVPSAFRRTFTMKEFARLAGIAPVPGSAADAVATVAARRGTAAAAVGRDDDVPDPYRGTIAEARVAAAQISAAVREAVVALGLSALVSE